MKGSRRAKPKPTARRGVARLFGATRVRAAEAELATRQRLAQTDLLGHSKAKGYRYKRTGTHGSQGIYDRFGPDGQLISRGHLQTLPGKRRAWWRTWTLAKNNVGRDRRGRFTKRSR